MICILVVQSYDDIVLCDMYPVLNFNNNHYWVGLDKLDVRGPNSYNNSSKVNFLLMYFRVDLQKKCHLDLSYHLKKSKHLPFTSVVLFYLNFFWIAFSLQTVPCRPSICILILL